MNCFHCAELVEEPGRWQVVYDSQPRDVCCAGCMAVMQAIVDAGLADYYRFRTEPAQFGVIPENLQTSLDELAVFDEPEISERYLQPVAPTSVESSDLKQVKLSVEGLRCGACVWVLERTLKGSAGVHTASVNFSSGRASVCFDPAVITLSSLLQRMATVGYRAMPFDVREREIALQRESRLFIQRLFIAGIATMQVMMYALPVYVSGEGDMDTAHEQLLRWASLILTTPVVFFAALPFFKGAARDLGNKRPGMDVPVSIAILVAYTASLWATLSGKGEIYFDSVAMFVFLLLGARYLEWTARRRAMRVLDDISSSTPETAQRRMGDALEKVPAARLRVNDEVVVDQGDRIPVDGEIVEGHSAVDNSLVTGEYCPVRVQPGDSVAGGALLSGAQIVLRVVREQSSSTLSVIDQLVERGASEKPATVRMADSVASLFVTLLLVFASLVYLSWLFFDPEKAATTAIAVLVVSCPCALSLATPAALAAATANLLKRRLLITRGHTLDTLSKVSDVVFDKTGTLTTGQPVLVGMDVVGAASETAALELALALECGSAHPFASALRHAGIKRGLVVPVSDARTALASVGVAAQSVRYEAGHGLCAILDDGESLFLGSRTWCAPEFSTDAPGSAEGDKWSDSASEVCLVRTINNANGVQSRELLARFLFHDEIRPDVQCLLDSLNADGKQVHLLSGDRLAAVQAVAQRLGINRVRAEAMPDDKQAYVLALQAAGGIVMMVGDGINDAPVLASAHVSVAAGEATTLARNAADVISLQPGLDGIAPLLRKASQTKRVVRQNLVWAATYNAMAIPLAALGLVPPWLAAIGMAGSSLLVVFNSQRLWRDSRGSVASLAPAITKPLWNRYSY